MTVLLPALGKISLISQILTDSDNQTKTPQFQVIVTWNALSLIELKGRKSETWIDARNLSPLGYRGQNI